MTSSMRFVVACLALLPVASVFAQSLDATLCGKSDFGNSTELPWSFNNNAWGNITGQAEGYQCMKLYDAGASWTVTYKWTGDASTVKSYPYMKVHPSNLPAQLNKIDELNIDGSWQTWVTGTENGSPGEQAAAYDRVGLIANVAIDLFLAPDATASTVVGSPIEMMIWPWWVPTILPLGWLTSTPQKDTIEVNGVRWSLYHGINQPGQNVFSWLAQTNVSSMSGDYSPLLKYLYTSGYLDGGLWVGQLELGQEIKQATAETNFRATVSRLEIVRNGEGEQSIQEAPAPTPTPTPEPTPTPTPEPQTTTIAPPPPETTEAPGTSVEVPVTSETVAPPEKTSTSAEPVTTSVFTRPIANPSPTTASSSSTTTPAPTTQTTGTFIDSLVSIDSIPSTSPHEPVADPATTMDASIPVSTEPITSTISIEPTTNAPPSTEPPAPSTTTAVTTTTPRTSTAVLTTTTTNPPATTERPTTSSATTSRIVTSTTTTEPAPAAPTNTNVATSLGVGVSSWLMIPAALMALL